MARAKPTKPDPDAVLLTAPEAAWLTRLSIATIYVRLRDGDIESVINGSRRLIPRSAIDKYIANLARKPPGSPGRPGRPRKATAPKAA